MQSSAACNDARKHRKARLLRLLASGTELLGKAVGSKATEAQEGKGVQYQCK